MPLGTLGVVMFKVLALLTVGFFLKRTGLVDDTIKKGFSEFLVRAVLPCNILASANSEFSDAIGGQMLQTMWINVGYYAVLLPVLWFTLRTTKWDRRFRGLFLCLCVFANVGFIGMPLVEELFGHEAVLLDITCILSFQLLFYTVGALFMSGESAFHWGVLWKNPSTVASVLGILLYISPLRFPQWLMTPVEAISDMTVPLSLMLIGCGLSGVPLRKLILDGRAWAAATIRLLALPLCVLLVLRALRIDPYVAAVCAVIFATPSGSLNVMLAEHHENHPEFASAAVVLSTFLLMLTLPLILLLVNGLLY